jgi:transaldolase
MTLEQVREVAASLDLTIPSCISVFPGKIADTRVDPLPMMREAVRLIGSITKTKLIWASPRELLNVFHTDTVGCHSITATNDILKS